MSFEPVNDPRLASDDPGVRRIAVLDIADAEDDADLPTLTAALLGDPAAEVRAEAARVLGGWDHADAVDALAAALLDAAERLTEALQEAAGRRALHIVNQCGRQRMRVQRLAKECLLDAAHPELEALPTRHDKALDAFEAALAELEEAPLSTPEIRTSLAQVRDHWLRLLGGLRSVETEDGRRALVQASEAILERLDTLTAAYEHSLQVIMA